MVVYTVAAVIFIVGLAAAWGALLFSPTHQINGFLWFISLSVSGLVLAIGRLT